MRNCSRIQKGFIQSDTLRRWMRLLLDEWILGQPCSASGGGKSIKSRTFTLLIDMLAGIQAVPRVPPRGILCVDRDSIHVVDIGDIKGQG